MFFAAKIQFSRFCIITADDQSLLYVTGKLFVSTAVICIILEIINVININVGYNRIIRMISQEVSSELI